jgi:hypothetical protein
MEPRPFYLAVDFDDTLRLRGQWGKEEGVPNLKVIELVKRLKKLGWVIILWTCRPIDDVIFDWCESHEVPVDFYNENPHAIEWFKRNYGFSNWSHKVFADVYLDDSAINPFSSFSQEFDELYDDPSLVAEQINALAARRHAERSKVDKVDSGKSS